MLIKGKRDLKIKELLKQDQLLNSKAKEVVIFYYSDLISQGSAVLTEKKAMQRDGLLRALNISRNNDDGDLSVYKISPIMKFLFKNPYFKKVIVPLVFIFFFFVLSINVHAQTISSNTIKAPMVVAGKGSLDPDIIKGSDVIVTNSEGSTCSAVTYEWESASDSGFTKGLENNLSTARDYDPGIITRTTYFRRIASVECTSPDRAASSTCSGIKITIL